MAEQKEILESIRDIIAGKDDGEVLELTQMVNPDGSVTEIKPKKQGPAFDKQEAKAAEAPKPAPAAKTKEPEAGDILSEIDSVLNEGTAKRPADDENVELELADKQEFEELAAAAAPEEPKTENKPDEVAANAAIMPRPEAEQKPEFEETNATLKGNKMENNDTIISETSANEARESLAQLTSKLKKEGKEHNRVEPSAPFRSGATVEDLVIEMLKPMMKDWLDKNLPKLVNEIVSKEIQKLVPKD